MLGILWLFPFTRRRPPSVQCDSCRAWSADGRCCRFDGDWDSAKVGLGLFVDVSALNKGWEHVLDR
jgi:hypothetical protein